MVLTLQWEYTGIISAACLAQAQQIMSVPLLTIQLGYADHVCGLFFLKPIVFFFSRLDKFVKYSSQNENILYLFIVNFADICEFHLRCFNIFNI